MNTRLLPSIVLTIGCCTFDVADLVLLTKRLKISLLSLVVS